MSLLHGAKRLAATALSLCTLATAAHFSPVALAQTEPSAPAPPEDSRTMSSDFADLANYWNRPGLTSSDIFGSHPAPSETSTPTPNPEFSDVVPDTDFRRYLNTEHLGRADTPDAPISAADMATLTHLSSRTDDDYVRNEIRIWIPDANGKRAEVCGTNCEEPAVRPNLEGVQYAINLKSLAVYGVSRYPEFDTMPNLKELVIDSAETTPVAGINGTNFPVLDRLTVHNNVSENLFSDDLESLKTLRELRLSAHSISKLPAGTTELSNLEQLYLLCDGLTELPEDIGNLTSLVTLGTHGFSKMTSVPESIGNLTNLKTLDLRRLRELTELPDSIGNLHNLESLALDGNRSLTVLPSSVFELTNLKRLMLRNVPLTELPEEISQLQALESLNIMGTEINSLPESMLSIPNLKELLVDWRNFKNDPVYLQLRDRSI